MPQMQAFLASIPSRIGEGKIAQPGDDFRIGSTLEISVQGDSNPAVVRNAERAPHVLKTGDVTR